MRGPLVVVLGFCAGACTHESPAGSMYRLTAVAPAACAHPVRLVPRDERFETPYRVVADLNTTCGALTPNKCDTALLERACKLGADAVWLKGSSYVGPLRRPSMNEDSVAVVFVPPPAATSSN